MLGRPWQLQLVPGAALCQGEGGHLGGDLCQCSCKFLTVILGFDYELIF